MPNQLDIVCRWCGTVLPHHLRKFSKFLDLFGPVRMLSDALGCIRKHSDAILIRRNRSELVWTSQKTYKDIKRNTKKLKLCKDYHRVTPISQYYCATLFPPSFSRLAQVGATWDGKITRRG